MPSYISLYEVVRRRKSPKVQQGLNWKEEGTHKGRVQCCRDAVSSNRCICV